MMCMGLNSAHALTKKILIIGDSLSTAYGINHNEGWVSLLTQRLHAQAPNISIINESISGQTTAAALSELPRLLSHHQPTLVVIELGGNDGLQGLPLAHIKNNLTQMIQLAANNKAQVLLLGMQLPPNYGARYTEGFKNIYQELAKHYNITLVPFLLKGVGGYIQYMQYDNIHPSGSAQVMMLDNVWPYLQPLLK